MDKQYNQKKIKEEKILQKLIEFNRVDTPFCQYPKYIQNLKNLTIRNKNITHLPENLQRFIR
ncbi:MAG: hypothetical protein IJV35_08340 [Neisseriaceae bacterium]|nr:hypothetical protein [Neisseriaceae bacterium]